MGAVSALAQFLDRAVVPRGKILFARRQRVQQQPHHAAAQRLRRGMERFAGHRHPCFAVGRAAVLEPLRRQRVQILALHAQRLRRLRDVRRGGAVERREPRHDLMADVVAGIGVVEVHHVQPMPEAVGLGIRLDLRAAHAQKWADVDAPHRGDAAEAAPCAADELKEQRLGVVVGVVRRGDAVRADLARRAG